MTSKPVLAHRNGPLRVCLAVVAAMQVGAILVIAPAWAPGRAAFAIVALGLGALAALAAVVLMGTRHPIGNGLRAVLAIALAGSWLGPNWAGMMVDPTQAQVPDLELSVRCGVSPDMQSVTARVEFSWQKTDLGPALPAAPRTDSLQIQAEMPEYVLPELNGFLAPDAQGMSWVGSAGTATGYWSAHIEPDLLTLDGRPSQRWVALVVTDSDWPWGWQQSGSSSWTSLAVSNGALQAGARYGVTWTFQRNPDAPRTTLDKMLPVFVAEYRHLESFGVQAYASCGDPSRSWPNQSTDWGPY